MSDPLNIIFDEFSM